MSDSFFWPEQNELTMKNCFILVWFPSFRFFSLFTPCRSEYVDLALDQGPGDRTTAAPHHVWSWPWSSVYFAAVTLINVTCPADSPVDVMAHRAAHHTPRWRRARQAAGLNGARLALQRRGGAERRLLTQRHNHVGVGLPKPRCSDKPELQRGDFEKSDFVFYKHKFSFTAV